VNPADSPILILSLTSDTLPLAQVFDAANTILAQKISQVEGVGQVTSAAGSSRRCASSRSGGARRHRAQPRGRAHASRTTVEPAQGESQRHRSSLDRRERSALHGRGLPPLVVAYRTAQAVRLGDVATSSTTSRTTASPAGSDGQRSVLAHHPPQPDANIIETIERVKALCPELSASISPAIKIGIAATARRRSARRSRRRVHARSSASASSWSSSSRSCATGARRLIPSVAVPLSLVGTFGVMYLLGYSLDNLSLMALTISTGFVVDDAIVVTENITRFIEEGEPPFEAALKGAKQIGFTIVSITVSLLAVFIPILLMGGIVGRLFREFAVTLSVAIAVSALVSLTLTPMMCARLSSTSRRADGRLYRSVERGFDGMLGVLRPRARWVLRTARSCSWSRSGTVALTVVLFMYRPEGPLPAAGHRHAHGPPRPPQDVSFPAMKERQTRSTPSSCGSGRRPRRRRSSARAARVPSNTGACSSRSSRSAPQGVGRRDHRALRPSSRRSRGSHLPAGAPGRQRRRPPRPHAVPVHAAGREPRRARLGAEDARRAEASSRAQGRRDRSAERGLSST
jgi:multidrug efflux pump